MIVCTRGKGHRSERGVGVSACWQALMFYFAVSLDGGRRDLTQGESAVPLVLFSMVATLRTQGCLLACLWTLNKDYVWCGLLASPKDLGPPFR